MKLSRRKLLYGAGGLLCASAFALSRGALADDTAEYFYDPLGRLIRVELSDGTIVVYAYDAAGNRIRVIHGDDVPFNQTLQITGTGPVDLRTVADMAGYTGVTDASITFQLGSAITITGAPGAPHGGMGIDTGVWPSATKAIALSLEISGKVYGGGGSGEGSGGDAISCRENISILVNPTGQVRSGGGGGATGGGWEYSFQNAEGQWETQNLLGGGGGGGFPNGPASGNSSPGTTSGGGAGGTGGPAGGGRNRGAGGAGGGAAAAGSAGAAAGGTPGCNPAGTQCWNGPIPPSAAGAAGYAVRKNGKTVTVTNNGGVISGTVG